MQNPLAEDFFEQIYFPAGLKLWDENSPLPENSVVMVPDYILLKRKDVTQQRLGDNSEFGILINKIKK